MYYTYISEGDNYPETGRRIEFQQMLGLKPNLSISEIINWPSL